MEETVDIIGTLIDELRETSTISVVAVSGSNYTFTTINLKSLAVGDEVIFPNISTTARYTITAIDTVLKKFTVVSTVSLVTATSWKALSPYYWHGTPMMVNSEFRIKDRPRGYFVFLFEAINEAYDMAVESSIERTPSIEMYFMKYCKAGEWTATEHYTNVIKKVAILVDNFKLNIENNKLFSTIENFSKINYADWGSYLKDRGFVDRILDQKFSGIGINFDLPIKKIITC